jgi:myo-inositol 2-dehydrogenase/D-chiro-inositol 1-dehydrogenase
MRIGIAGVGRIGAMHAQTLSTLDAVTTLVVADVDAERAAAVAAQLGSEHVPGLDQLWSAGLDGLVIATSSAAHADLILAAVDAGIPVFCEKPVATDVEQTRRVLEGVTAGDVPVQIGFQRRFDPAYAAAREAVSSGALGWLHTVRAGTLDPAPPPAEFIATSGGLFRDCGVHDFDAIRWVCGQEVVEVYAAGANHGADYFVQAGDVDACSALLTLSGGTFAHVAGSRYNALGYDVRLELLGSADSVCVGLSERLPLRSAEPGVQVPAAQPYTVFTERFREAYVAELAAFCEVAAGRQPSSCTVADALEAFLVAEACELSRREHRAVSVEEVRG